MMFVMKHLGSGASHFLPYIYTFLFTGFLVIQIKGSVGSEELEPRNLSSSNQTRMRMMTGGLSQVREGNPEVQEIALSVKAAAEEALGRTFPEFSVKQYKSQVVAGINYFVKVHVGEEKYIHLRIFQSLQNKVALHGVQDEKMELDDISYF